MQINNHSIENHSTIDTHSAVTTSVNRHPLPRGVCVKVSSLRPHYTDLSEWMKIPGHILVTRHGRVFIGSGTEKHIFHYPQSPWANPFSLKNYSLEDSLSRYEQYLDELLRDNNKRTSFLSLARASQIGCFCDPGARCHRDIILKKLCSLLKQ